MRYEPAIKGRVGKHPAFAASGLQRDASGK